MARVRLGALTVNKPHLGVVRAAATAHRRRCSGIAGPGNSWRLHLGNGGGAVEAGGGSEPGCVGRGGGVGTASSAVAAGGSPHRQACHSQARPSRPGRHCSLQRAGSGAVSHTTRYAPSSCTAERAQGAASERQRVRLSKDGGTGEATHNAAMLPGQGPAAAAYGGRERALVQLPGRFSGGVLLLPSRKALVVGGEALREGARHGWALLRHESGVHLAQERNAQWGGVPPRVLVHDRPVSPQPSRWVEGGWLSIASWDTIVGGVCAAGWGGGGGEGKVKSGGREGCAATEQSLDATRAQTDPYRVAGSSCSAPGGVGEAPGAAVFSRAPVSEAPDSAHGCSLKPTLPAGAHGFSSSPSGSTDPASTVMLDCQ
jgi:hypothetical protein